VYVLYVVRVGLIVVYYCGQRVKPLSGLTAPRHPLLHIHYLAFKLACVAVTHAFLVLFVVRAGAISHIIAANVYSPR
jgi:hypothetical protein